MRRISANRILLASDEGNLHESVSGAADRDFTADALYTGVTIVGRWANLLPVFFGDIGRFARPGQFDLDFMGMLALSAIRVAWRHTFSGAGLGLAILAFFGGTGFLTAYLLVVSLRANGGIREILLGRFRATTHA